MKKKISKLLVIIAIPLTVNFIVQQWLKVSSQTLSPIHKKVGNLNVSIDPRIELLSIIQGISDYDMIQRNNRYYNQVKSYFVPFSGMQAIASTNTLDWIGFSYDAPVDFMLYLNQPNACSLAIPYSDELIKRAQGEKNLVDYQNSIQEFAEESKFNEFWNGNKPFYNKIIDLTLNELSGIDWVAALENYFNETHNSYNLIITPLFKGGYGTYIPKKNGEKDLYAFLPPNWNLQADVPYIDQNSLKEFLWHEFAHSFINPETEKQLKSINASSELFEPLQERMTKQAYNTWPICVNEHIVRAICIRLTETYIGKEKAEQMLSKELNQNFVYLKPILEKLKIYENERKTHKITFADFLPEIVNVFDSISKTDYKTAYFSEKGFSGPINNVFQAPQMAVIYPTGIMNEALKKNVKSYIQNIQQNFFKDGLLIPDTIANKIDLSSFGLMIYGTITSNKFLQKYKSILPFESFDFNITDDKKQNESAIKLIACIPNPQNENYGMVIYTALRDEDILDINNVFHGPEDYILFVSRNQILKKGYFNKEGRNWTLRD